MKGIMNKINLNIVKRNLHVFLSYFTETLMIQITQFILIIFSFKFLSNELFYSLGIIQIAQSIGILYYDSGIYTIVKTANYGKSKLRNHLLSISVYRFVAFFLFLLLLISLNFLFKLYKLNIYFFFLIPYIGITFFSGLLTTIMESDGKLYKISYIRSIATSVISIIFSFFIFHFKNNYFYISQLYLIQIILIFCILFFFKFNFKIKKPRFSNLFRISKRVKYTKNNIWLGFLVENSFLIVNYFLLRDTASIATFFKLDKYLKVFFGFLLGFYQRTFFYIQLQQNILYSVYKGIIAFVIISLLGLIPLWYFLTKLHDFNKIQFLILSIFYLIIYTLLFVSFMNTISMSKKIRKIINFLIITILLIYFLYCLNKIN